MIDKKDIEKAEILIEALPYIQRFNGKIIIIKCGGSVMENPELMASIIEDVVLLKLVGFKPVIVHGGGKEISHWIKKHRIIIRSMWKSFFYCSFMELVICQKVSSNSANDE